MMKRVFVAVLALLICCCTLAAAEKLEYHSDFTRDTDGWYPRSAGEAVLEVTDEGLRITGRTATWNSPGRAFDLIPGERYRLSVEVKQDEIAEGRFILSAEHSANGEVSYENITAAQVKQGEWTRLQAVWVPGNFDSFVLYVEGGEADTSFTIRNFSLEGIVFGAQEQEAAPEPFAMPADAGELSALFDGMEWKTSYKKEGENNPLYTQRFGADPGFLVWQDRLYVYTTNDVIEYNADGSVKENGYGLVDKINCISSTDLVNWTDHGAIPVAGSKGILTWARNSWAPCAAHKVIDGKDQFFLYSCNNGNGVTVLVADDPQGPFRDPLGKGLITRQTPNCANVTWLFDPAVFVDEDGTGYLYFGGGVPDGRDADPGTGRCVQLGEDMISIVGEPRTIDVPYLFEDSGMLKIGDTYYYSYCSNWNTKGNPYGMGSGAIQYMTSKDPLGPFEYAGQAFVNQGTFFGLWGNNHHSMVEFGGVHYLLYHSRPVEQGMGITGNYRSPQMDVMTVNEDGSIKPVVGTMKGVAQLHNFDPYQQVAAQTMYREAGIEVTGYGPDAVTRAESGDWMQLKNVDFATGCKRFTLCAGSAGGGAVRIALGGMDGTVLCEMVIEPGEMKEYTVECAAEAGVTDLYLLFAGDVEAKWWQAE